MTKKILFPLTPAFNPNEGGVQRTTWKLGKYFTEQGYDVSYYSLAKNGHVESPYGTLYTAPEEGKSGNPANIRDLKQVLKKEQPDVVINQMPYERELRDALSDKKEEVGYLLLGCLRNSLFNFKNNARDRMEQMLPELVFNMLDNKIGIGFVQLRHKRKHARDLRAIIDRHDYFILLAPPNRKELEYFVGAYKKEKVISIPNSIPKVGDMDILEKKEKIILHVGRLNVQQKRSDLLAPFWEALYDRLPEWNFIIVGDGPYFQKLKNEIAKKDLPRVSLEGYQKPEPYYRKASVFTMPSAYEGFPNTLLEAQSFGCAPVLFNSYDALDWITQEGENSLLVPPFNTQQMADQTADLISNPQKLKELQQRALENAHRFTIDKVGQQWEEFFKEAVN